jgi:putative endonuclease
MSHYTTNMQHRYYVYILTNYDRTVLYTGVSNNLSLRLQQHSEDAIGAKKTFAGRYNCIYLLYFEEYQLIYDAIAREKEIKDLSRNKKEALIRMCNPDFIFLNHDQGN